MILKLAAIFVLLGVCCALPVEESKPHEITTPTYGLTSKPTHESVQKLPNKPKPNEDLKPDASTWYYNGVEYTHIYPHHHPLYYYDVHSVPYYTYWQPHW